mgnify:CR=1 FL=1
MSQIKLTADSGGGTTSLKAPSSTTSNADVVLKLPVADGSSGQVLKTDGSGQLSFTSNAGTTINNNGSNRIITGSGTANTLEGEANLTYNGSGITLTGTNPYIDIVDSNNDSDFSIKNDNGTFEINDATNSDATRLAIPSSGGVGIGIASTSRTPLHIHEPTSATANIHLTNSTTGSGATDGLTIWHDGGTSAGIFLRENLPFRIGTNNTDRMRIDSSGNVGIGLTDPASYYAKNLVVKAPSEGGMTIRNTGGNDWNYIMFASGTSGAERYDSYIGVDHGNNKVRIATNETVANKNVELRSNGNFSISDGDLVLASGHGIDFSATANGGVSTPSELFDDYEVGLWTPEWAMSNGGHNITYWDQQGSYVKVGRMVFLQLYLRTNVINANGTGSLFVANLPFTSANNTQSNPAGEAYGSASIGYVHTWQGTAPTSAYVPQNNTQLFVYAGVSGGDSVAATVANNIAGGTQFRATVTYLAA